MNNKSSKKKKSGGSPLPLFIFILIIGGVAASNFVGPAKGWMTGNKDETSTNTADNSKEKKDNATLSKKNEDSNPNSQDTNTDSEKQNTANADSGEAETKTTPKKEMTEFERKHKEFFDEFMNKKKNSGKLPTIGRRYPVITVNGDLRDGILDKVGDYSIYLSKIKPYNAKSSIHYSQLRKDMAMYFFPKKAANTYANKMLEKYLTKNNIIAAFEEETAPPPNDGKKNASSSTAKTTYSRSLKSFDPTVAESSPRLAHAAMEVNNYLRNQVRITKKRDNFTFADVDKCHAKQHGASAVFYMYVTSSFASQSKEYKFQVIDGIRRFWALRCMSNGVAGDSRAFLCIVSGGKVIGGSKISSAEDIIIN